MVVSSGFIEKLHPAGILSVWCCLVVVLQRLPFDWLLPATVLAILAACIRTKSLFFSMLRRTRWLFLTLFVLFSTMTPGVFLPAPWGFDIVTQEGLLAAGEHMLRLVAMLGLVALLLGGLDQRTIVAGIFVLLRPLAVCGVDCERISVRLLLVFDYVAAERRDWRQLLLAPESEPSPASITLPLAPLQVRDRLLGGLAVTMAILGLIWL